MPVSKHAKRYRGYAVSPRMGRFDVYPPHSDLVSIAVGFSFINDAYHWIDEHIAEMAFVATLEEKEQDNEES